MSRLFKVLVFGFLTTATIFAFGGALYGWFLPQPLAKPVSIREGSAHPTRMGHGLYFFGRTHYGGGYAGGK